MDSRSQDRAVRTAAFAFLEDLQDRYGDVLPYAPLAEGFEFDGQRVPIIGPQGIFKPAALHELPLTIYTAPPKEGKAHLYEDRVLSDGLLEYCYRGQDPDHRDNRSLRLAMSRQVPLIYVRGLVPGRYAVAWPVYIVGDDPEALRFRVVVDDKRSLEVPTDAVGEGSDARRAYATVVAQRRLHQQSFRERVLHAYRTMCSICSLRHVELLDAAHILPDGHPRGDPVVPNGLALCRLHHAAFDGGIIGINPEMRVEVRKDVLDEEDGPMLLHGLQGFQGSALHVPKHPELRPDPARVRERYEKFLRAG